MMIRQHLFGKCYLPIMHPLSLYHAQLSGVYDKATTKAKIISVRQPFGKTIIIAKIRINRLNRSIYPICL